MVLIATGSQLTRYQQVEDKARMRMSVEKNWMKRETRYRKSHERSKDCPASKEMQENVMESMQHQLQEVEKRRNDLMPEHQKVQKLAQRIQSIQDKRKIYRKKAWRQEKKCGKSEKEECFTQLSDKVDKNTMADAETEAELQGLQAGEERRGSNASQAVECCLETMAEQIFAFGNGGKGCIR